LSTSLLKVALMSFVPGFKSPPASLLANASTYHVLGMGAPLKSLKATFGPAKPSVALLAEPPSGSMLISTRIVTPLVTKPPRMLAAC
jgi:hypothetical protein